MVGGGMRLDLAADVGGRDPDEGKTRTRHARVPEEGPGSPRVPATRVGGAYGVIRRPLRPARNEWRVVEQRLAPSPAAALWKPTVTWRRPAFGSIICARFPWVRKRTLPSRMTLIFMPSRCPALATACLRSANTKARRRFVKLAAGMRAQKASVPPSGRICRKTSSARGFTARPERVSTLRRASRVALPRGSRRPPFTVMAKVPDCRQHAGSSKSVRPLLSSSMQLPQISAGAASGVTQVLVWTHTPLLQLSVVQALKSLHWLADVQGVQPEIGVLLQTPALQESVVQALSSLQSEAVVQSVQPVMEM